MFDSTASTEPDRPSVGASRSLDETIWRAWLERNSAQDKQREATRVNRVRWGCIALLAFATIAGSQATFHFVPGYTEFTQFAITIGGIVLARATWIERRYGLMIGFIAVLVLCNPFVPEPWLFGNWPLFVLSAIPFILWRGWKGSSVRAASISPEVTGVK